MAEGHFYFTILVEGQFFSDQVGIAIAAVCVQGGVDGQTVPSSFDYEG